MNTPDYRKLDGVEVTNQDGEKLGKVSALFVDDDLEIPTWVAVRSGLFGNHHCLVPLTQTRFVDGRLLVPYSKDDLALAPHTILTRRSPWSRNNPCSSTTTSASATRTRPAIAR